MSTRLFGLRKVLQKIPIAIAFQLTSGGFHVQGLSLRPFGMGLSGYRRYSRGSADVPGGILQASAVEDVHEMLLPAVEDVHELLLPEEVVLPSGYTPLAYFVWRIQAILLTPHHLDFLHAGVRSTWSVSFVSWGV